MGRTALLSYRAATAAMSILVSSCVGEMQSIDGKDEPIDEEGASVPGDAPGGGTGSDLPVPAVDPAIKDAMRRDLGLTAREVDTRLAIEARASTLEPTVRAETGAAYAGSWLDDVDLKLHVGITDAALMESVRARGAEPHLVKRSLAALEAIKAKLDLRETMIDGSIHAWSVDVINNKVLVEVAHPDSPVVASFIAGLGDADAVEVVTSPERPRPLYDLRGGDEYIINSNTLCSVGFSVNGGFVTAGHCGGTNSPTAGSNWVAQGTFRGSSFPGNDYGWVQINGNWNSLPEVSVRGGGPIAVQGSQVAAIGSSVCRSGRTTGWRCGTIMGYNQTVNYANGPVHEMTKTNACAEGGDSGGSFISGNQAQGVTSGGWGNCSSGGETWFQPVNEILSVYGLSLKTSGGGGAKAIVSRLNNMCIDVPGSNFVDGARVQMYGCNGTGAQQWTFVNGTIRAGGKCLDVAGANSADGTPIQIVGCNGHPAQQFVLNGAGDLVSIMANKCVDIAGWNANERAQLLIWPCHGGANQKWYTR
jgi:streptogrisin C